MYTRTDAMEIAQDLLSRYPNDFGCNLETLTDKVWARLKEIDCSTED